VRVSRAAAQKRGKGGRKVLKKGCKYAKGDGALCRKGTSTTKRKGRKKAKRKSAKKKAHYYSANSPLPFKKGKTKKKVLKKGCSRVKTGKYRGKVRCRRKMSRSKRRAA
jgi:hypothetical protein